jgi:membrane protein implicated in regulation of membrane protease activity
MTLSEIFSQPELVWFIIGLVLLLLEIILPGTIIIFFGVGAWITSLFCLLFDIGINIQILIFILTSVGSLILLRRFLIQKLYKKGKDDQTLEDEFVNKFAEVKSDIKPDKPGKVIFKGTNWTAESDFIIKKGQRVKILSKDSITLKVKPLSKKN